LQAIQNNDTDLLAALQETNRTIPLLTDNQFSTPNNGHILILFKGKPESLPVLQAAPVEERPGSTNSRPG
jgi:hypothetical protein